MLDGLRPDKPALAVLTALLLLFAIPVGVAQYDGSDGGQGDGADGGDGGPGAGDQNRGDNKTRDKAQVHDRANRTGPPAEIRDRARAHAQAWTGLSQAQRDQAGQNARAAGLFDLFTYQDGQLDGRFVDLGVDLVNGTLANVTVTDGDRNATYFDSVTIDPYEGGQDPLVAGAVFNAMANMTSFSVHDNPTAQLRFLASNDTTTITFELGDNLTHNPAGPALRFDHTSGLHFHMVLGTEDGNLTVSPDNTTVTADLAPAATLLVLTHPGGNSANGVAIHERIEAARTGTLGGEISMVQAGDGIATDRLELGTRLDALHLSNGSAAVEVSRNVTTGQTVVINLPTDTFPAGADSVNVTIDGEIVPLAQASEVLASQANDTALASITSAEASLQVAVHVPSFSTHTIELTETTTDGDTTDGEDTTTDGEDNTTDGEDTTTDGGDTTDGQDPGQETPAVGLIAVLATTLAAAAITARRD